MKRLAVLLLLASVMAAECPGSDDSTGPNNSSIVGTWTLVTINGSAVPTTFTLDGEQLTVTSGSATVNANGTFTWSETYSSGSDGVSGTWSAASSANTFIFDPTETEQEPDQSNGTSVVSGNSMTLTIAGESVVRGYQKQ